MRDSGPISVVETSTPRVIPRSEATRNLSSGAAREIPRSARDDSAHNGGVLLNFAFNGWAKYDDYKKDAKVVTRANAKLKRRVVLPEHKGRRVVLEGGSIDVNGLRNAADHRRVSAEQSAGAQSRIHARGLRGNISPLPRRHERASGSAAESRATTRTGMWTISLDSSMRRPW